ncbi:MAG: bifunctional alpha/beta hydrolase/OsmC family protein, partial [Bacteroidota bacterium]
DQYQAPQLLVGHSLGGAAVLMAAAALPSIKAVATVAAPAEPEHVKHLFAAVEARIHSEGEARVEIAGRPFTIRKHFLEDLAQVRLADVIGSLKRALLILHSPQDKIVGIENAKQIYEAARHPKSFMTLDGADHLLMDKADSIYAGQVISQWATRYLDLPAEVPLVTDKQAVVRLGGQGFTSEVQVGKHRFLADEPSSVGGDDLGPSPYDLLAASLGTCTAMTLRMYANHKGWAVREIRVHLEHYKDYPQDQIEPENQKSKIDHVDRHIEIEGDLDEKQRQRLLEIADRCPVHRTLHSEVVVRTQLRE